MAAGMALASADITPQLDTFTGTPLGCTKCGVVVRRNRMTVTQNGEQLFVTENVQRVERLSARRWRITTDEGVYDIERLSGGCGCARGG